MDQITTTAVPAIDMVLPAGGTTVWAVGILVTIKVFAKDTGGSYSLFEDIVPPGSSPPKHYHTREDETWYILDGELEWHVGDKVFQATKGCFIHLPKFVPHTFINKSGKMAHMVLTYAPGGFENWFVEIGDSVADRDAPGQDPPVTPELVANAIEHGKNYGIVFLGHDTAEQEIVHNDEL